MLRKPGIFVCIIAILITLPSNMIMPQVNIHFSNVAMVNHTPLENHYPRYIHYEDETPIYKNPGYSIDQRIEDLLSRMSLEEKIGQMNMPALFVKDLGESIEEKMEGCKEFARGTYEEGIGPGGGFYSIPDKMLHNGPRQQAEIF